LGELLPESRFNHAQGQDVENMPAKNILIADDDQVILHLLEEILQMEGYQTFLVSNGEEAVEAAKKYPIDVAILDKKMPITDGIEALKQIKKIDSTIEVLIMTGYADIETLEQSLIDYGAFDYLLKPLKIKREGICNAVRNALLKRAHALKDDFIEKELNNRVLQLEKDFEDKTRQLRESQIKYKEIVENSTDGIFIAQDENLKFVNPKVLELTGFTEKEILNIPFIKLIYPEDRPMVIDRFMRRLQGDETPSPYIFRVLKKDGDWFWVEINSVRTIWEERPAVMANIKDINDRVESEKKLRESEEKYRDLADSIVDTFFAMDEDFKYIYWNKASEELTGISAKDAIGKHILDIFPNNNETRRAMEIYQEVLETQQAQTFVNEYHLGGNRYFFEVSAYPSSKGLSVFVKDITDRKRVEDTLRESEEKYRTLFESSKDPIYITTLDGAFVDVNGAFLDLFGYTSGDLTDLRARDVYVNPDQRFIFRDEIERKRFVRDYELKLRKKNGEEMNCLVTASVRQADDRSILCYQGFIRDVTEQRRAEDELTKSREQLRNLSAYLQSTREQERTSIAREIHDDLGQTLTALKMDLSWLGKWLSKDQEPLKERQASMDKALDMAIESVERIITELRPGMLDDLGLVAAIEWQVGDFQNRTGVRSEVNIDPEEIILNKERSTAIFRILQECLTNVARHANATKVNVSLIKKDGEIVLQVRDNGKGIAKEQISHPKSFGLMGIRERVYVFGGNAMIKGILEKGTTVIVRIPLEKEP
jgi:PAS domain S-box-containing protein